MEEDAKTARGRRPFICRGVGGRSGEPPFPEGQTLQTRRGKHLKANYIDFFEYQVMSFKLINTSVSFQVYVNSMLKDMIQEQAMTFLDDILIMKQTYKELQ